MYTLTGVGAGFIVRRLLIPYISTMQNDSATRTMPPRLGLRAVFQSIVSVSGETVCGYEGLIRGVDETGKIITPYLLFEQAVRGGYLADLDRRCRETIIEAFASRFSHNDDIRLFLNVHPDVISDASVPKQLFEAVNRYGLLPGNIVVEVDECRVETAKDLERFAEACREYGFKLALDDFGTFPCDPLRISFIQPEVLKIDISLVKEMAENQHASLAVKTLVQLAVQTGTLVIAEGVETEQEALQVLEAGCCIIQGFYFSRPVDISSLPFSAITKRLRDLHGYLSMDKNSRQIRSHHSRSAKPDGGAPLEYVIIKS